jgi:dTDP-glucose 4,6-dehydratase
LTRRILTLVGKSDALIQNVKDRPGHDRRYSLDTTKLKRLGWEPQQSFDEGLAATVDWYRERTDWWQPIKTRGTEYRQFYQKHYGGGAKERS